MPLTITRFEPTPNPNAVKCILDRPISEGPRSFRSADDAAADPVASRLFGVPGVVNVLMNGGWMSVNKAPEADWPSVKRGVQRVLADLP